MFSVENNGTIMICVSYEFNISLYFNYFTLLSVRYCILCQK